MLRSVCTSLCEVAGLGLVALGVWSQWPWAGGVVAGVGLVVVGWVEG